jgi:hypothetical protein
VRRWLYALIGGAFLRIWRWRYGKASLAAAFEAAERAALLDRLRLMDEAREREDRERGE